MKKLLILGHGQHGKGTVCKILADELGIESLSSSRAALPYIFNSLKASVGEGYQNFEVAYRCRHNHRLLWKELISLLNSPDKTILSNIILNQVAVYDGMRCHLEFEASYHLFDEIWWIDRSNYVGKDASMSIEFDRNTMVYIDNNGSESDLRKKVLDQWLSS